MFNKMLRSKQEAMKRKKHRRRLRKEAPLPILTTERVEASDPPCRFFTGYLLGCSVIIQHSGDIDFLYNMGFFGKGNLSRSEPTFDTRQQRVNLPAMNETFQDGAHMVQAIVTSKRNSHFLHIQSKNVNEYLQRLGHKVSLSPDPHLHGRYLAHLRYKALSDDEESVYNGIVQHEQLQLSAYGDDGEEDLEDEEEDEDYEEEEDDLENNDIPALGRYAYKSDKNTKLTPEELYKMPRSLLMALMTQVALLSKEEIATFIRVPYGLAELETKFKMMRAKQVAFLEGFSEAPTQTSLSTLFSSLKAKSSYTGGDSGFGKKGIINLEEGNNDAVVVLNSDDEEEDGEEEEQEIKRKSPNYKNDQKAVAKGWDDSDNEGDADFWGLEEEKKSREDQKKKMGEIEEKKAREDEERQKEQGNHEKGREGSECSENSVKVSTVSGDVNEDKDVGTGDKETNKIVLCSDKDGDTQESFCDKSIDEIDENTFSFKDKEKHERIENEDRKGVNKNGIKDESSCVKKTDTEQNANVLDTVKEQDESNWCFGGNEGKEKRGELIASKLVPSDSCPVPLLSVSATTTIASYTTTANTTTTTTTTTSVASVENTGNSSDDDVICVEEESAKPANLHQYLSQVPASNSSGLHIITKPVTFLTSITEEPKFVSTRIGFRSWDNVLHFNFSGDHNHLPTGMAVHKEVEGNKTSPESNSFTLSASDIDNASLHTSVYERVYPPINSLVASLNSKGSVMKQRNDPVPFLDLALYNLQQRFTPHNVRAPPLKLPHPSRFPPPQNQTRHGPTSRMLHNVHPSLLQYQSHQKPSFWSHTLSQPGLTDKQKTSVHSQSSNSTSLSPALSSSLPSKATVSLSQLQFYIQIFLEDTGMNNGEAEKEIGKLNPSEKNVSGSDIMMQKLHAQLSKTGLLKMKGDSKGLETSFDQMSDDSLSKQSALHVFNKMLSVFMTSQQITLEHELLLLRILMDDEKSVMASAISQEMVSDLKSKLSPGQVNCLMERMDFVQICVDNRRRDQLSSNEIITIELSDDEEDKMDLEDERDNVKDICSKQNVSIDGSSAVSHREENESIEKNCEDSNRETLPVGEELIIKSNELDREELKRNSIEGDQERESILVGVKRQFNLLGEYGVVKESKKLKSGTEKESINDRNLNDGLQTTSCDSSDTPNNGERIDIAQDDGTVASSSKFDSAQKKSVCGTSNCLNEDTGVFKHESHVDGKGNQRERVGDNDDKKGNDDQVLLSTSENNVSISIWDCINEKEREKEGEKGNGKGFNSTSVKNGFDIGEEKGDMNGSRSANAVEELDEIYVGSSDEGEESIHGFFRGKRKAFSENRSVLNQYCQSDDEYGDNFVITNTSDEDEDMKAMNNESNGGWQWKRNHWHPCLKRDPYRTEERLHLMLEEAFFLTFGLGCLRILDQEMIPMTISLLWQRFVVIQEKFIPRYVAYHYFRSKGWVPKSGLKFGCDFILYREGPPFFHGSFSVVVVPVKAGTLTHMDGEDGELDFSHRWTSWIALSGLNRITEHVSKELMVCYVIFPKGLTEEESKSPKCLTQFKVKEVVVSRWVSTRERETKDLLEEMP